MAYRFKARSTVPGSYNLVNGALSALINLSDIKQYVNRGDGGIGTLIVPGHASNYATLTKETGSNARNGSGTCAKFLPLSSVGQGYWNFYIPATANIPFRFTFYWKKNTENFDGVLNISIWDTDQLNLFVDDFSIELAYNDTIYHQYLSGSFTTINTGLCRVQLSIQDGANTGWLYIDDIGIL